ncbi:conjugal transfer protein [Salmonella enterica subsp. enterica serovar Benue]|uniref:type IV secretion system protein n=1 Tax=Salmonella enterica TaxID=28901 RepID=UPI000FAE94A2|nr:type IV secretion system protein [Salmonella enterica]EDR3562102.1 conjugal transfer protein [Salmonella enterica subsp. enterica serovar Benue]MIW33713.1 conjugal transfer protein [Salmonella enterica subsp. enterica serovar Derby]EGG4120863.1 conjugal transfer protein [Salmonella enterica]EGG4135141.1 conjugal transfer protein [Salmonella enterica]EKS5411686.1 conjugal transfer protein [Salmonella enterica]
MKKSIIAATLLGAAFTSTVNASGIPVVDVASIAQSVQNALEAAQHAKEQMTAYTNIINQAKSQFEETKDMISGNWKLGDFVDQQLIDQVIPSDWQDIYNDLDNLESLRDKFNLKSDIPEVQEQYDQMLAGYEFLENSEKLNKERADNLKQLGNLLNSAETPQQKDDLKLRIQLEQVNIQNEQNRIANVSALMEQQEKLDTEKRMLDFMEKMEKGL